MCHSLHSQMAWKKQIRRMSAPTGHGSYQFEKNGGSTYKICSMFVNCVRAVGNFCVFCQLWRNVKTALVLQSLDFCNAWGEKYLGWIIFMHSPLKCLLQRQYTKSKLFNYSTTTLELKKMFLHFLQLYCAMSHTCWRSLNLCGKVLWQ